MIHKEWKEKIIFWKQFIDDIFFIFQGETTSITKFHDVIHDTIKFTFKQSLTNFLDAHLSLE